jgi:hypothetical protein
MIFLKKKANDEKDKTNADKVTAGKLRVQSDLT